jgi:hypothetical protein
MPLPVGGEPIGTYLCRSKWRSGADSASQVPSAWRRSIAILTIRIQHPYRNANATLFVMRQETSNSPARGEPAQQRHRALDRRVRRQPTKFQLPRAGSVALSQGQPGSIGTKLVFWLGRANFGSDEKPRRSLPPHGPTTRSP